MSQNFFSDSQKADIVKAIQAAERNSSGEIRVHIEKICTTENVLDRATEVFVSIGMNNTAQLNGVLFIYPLTTINLPFWVIKALIKLFPQISGNQLKHY